MKLRLKTARRSASATPKERLVALLGAANVLDRAEDLALYEYDGGVDKRRPDLVVFPRSTEHVAGVVRIAREFRLPLVGRGAGTGLSGGAIAREGGILIVFARMNRILEIDLENERAVVQPGVVNLDITAAAAAMWRRTRAARTPWRMASPPITCWGWKW
jgi:glycolate oxidase